MPSGPARARLLAKLLAVAALSWTRSLGGTRFFAPGSPGFVSGRIPQLQSVGRDESGLIRHMQMPYDLSIAGQAGGQPTQLTKELVGRMINRRPIFQEMQSLEDIDLHATIASSKKLAMQRRFDENTRRELNNTRDIGAEYKMRVAKSLLKEREVMAARKAKADKVAERVAQGLPAQEEPTSMVESLERRLLWTRSDTIQAWRAWAQQSHQMYYHRIKRNFYPQRPFGPIWSKHEWPEEIEFGRKNNLTVNSDFYLQDGAPPNMIRRAKLWNYIPRHLKVDTPEQIWLRTGVPPEEQKEDPSAEPPKFPIISRFGY